MEFEKVLRSLIVLKGDEDKKELLENFYTLRKSVLKSDNKILNAIKEEIFYYFEIYKLPPSLQILKDTFADKGRDDIKSFLSIYEDPDFLDKQVLYLSSDFRRLVDVLVDKQILKEYNKIVEESKIVAIEKTKVNIKGQTIYLKGVQDALRYVNVQSSDLLSYNKSGERLSGDITLESDEVFEEYEERERNPNLIWGIPFGLSKVDEVTLGLQDKQLLVVAGYSGGGKSLFCTNYLWRAATWYGYNVVLVTIEMDRKSVRRTFFVLHSNHPKFREKGYEPLKYNDVKRAKLTKGQKEFYKIVCDDLKNREGYGNISRYGSIRIEQPSGTFAFDHLKTLTEYLDMQERIDLLCVDYLGLLHMDLARARNDHRVNLANIIKDTKNLSLVFRNGDGLKVVTPHQINREGWTAATQTEPEGQYTPKALSETNEILASADLLLTTYLSDVYKEQGEMMLGGLKGREASTVPYHLVHANQETRYIGNLDLNMNMNSNPGDVMRALDPRNQREINFDVNMIEI